MHAPLEFDLAADADATRWCKRAQAVQVAFAPAAGTLDTLEGPVRYQGGDALMTGAAGDRWPVRRTVFDARYTPAEGTVAGSDGVYVKLPLPVLARRVDSAFAVRLADGQVLQGQPGDWLVQYGPGDQAIVADAIFRATYGAA